MPLLLDRIVNGTVKPGPGAVLDRAHPLASSVGILIPLNEGGGNTVRELITGSVGTLGTGVTWKTTPYGVGLDFNATTAAVVTFNRMVKLPVSGNTMLEIGMRRGFGTGGFAGGISTQDSAGNDITTWQNLNSGSIYPSYATGGQSYTTQGSSAVPYVIGAWYVNTLIGAGAADFLIMNGALAAGHSIGASGAASGVMTLGSSATNTLDAQLAYIVGFTRTLSDSERQLLGRAPFALLTTPSAIRRYWQFGVGSSGASGALAFVAGSATWSAAAAVGTTGSTGFAAGPTTWSLSAAVGTKGTLGFTAGSATWSLGADIGTTGSVGFVAGPATLSLGGVVEPFATAGFVAGAATWSLGGTAAGGPTVAAGLTWISDTFTLAFVGSLGWQAGAATWALGGATTAAVLSFRAGNATWHAAGTATPPAPPPPVAAVSFAAGPASWALHARYATAGGLSWKAGSANAPLLHAVAPVAAPPVWSGVAVNLTATRQRLGGQAVARLVLRTAAGDALPAEPLPAGVARVTFRRASGGEPVETVGMFEAVEGELAISVAWPAALAWNTLVYCSVTLDGQRVPEGGRSVVVLVAP